MYPRKNCFCQNSATQTATAQRLPGYGDPISGAQGLGQKNTVLAIWLSLTYLNPISSVGPAAYIAWQNTINSIQLYLKQRRDLQSAVNKN